MDDYEDIYGYELEEIEADHDEDDDNSICSCGSQCMNCLGMTWGDFL